MLKQIQNSQSEQRTLRFLVIVGIAMIAWSYVYRWAVTGQRYDTPTASQRTPAVADTAASSATQ